MIIFRLYKQCFKNLLCFDVYPPEISDCRIDKEFFYYYYPNPLFVLVKRLIRTRPVQEFLKVFTSSKILLIFEFFYWNFSQLELTYFPVVSTSDFGFISKKLFLIFYFKIFHLAPDFIDRLVKLSFFIRVPRKWNLIIQTSKNLSLWVSSKEDREK